MGLFRRSRTMQVVFDDEGVRRLEGDSPVESVAWDALQAVEILTTTAGPAAEDVFWVLHGAASGVVVPSGLMPAGLLERLQSLPGFDDEALIAAIGTATEARFSCWTRP